MTGMITRPEYGEKEDEASNVRPRTGPVAWGQEQDRERYQKCDAENKATNYENTNKDEASETE